LLSVPAATGLAGLLNDVWLAGVLLACALGTFTCFLPKPQGGHRGIAIIDALYRVLLGARRPALAAWSQGHAAFWDDAVRGPTPLRVAVCRNVLLEAACLAESEQYLRAQELLLGRIREVENAEEKGRLQVAVETFRTQSKFGPALEGLELEKEGKYEEAMDRYTNVLDQAPETAWVLVRRAFCLAKTGDPSGSKADLRRAMRLLPETATDRITVAWAKANCPFLEFRDGAGAVSLAKRAIQDEPLIQTYGILASGYAEMGDFRKAQETVMLALSKSSVESEKKELKKKLELFRDKKPEMDDWAPRATPRETSL
jgi:tetratricopeptide (TPR) repeat protein